MFQMIKNKNLIESSRQTYLMKSFKASNNLKCILECTSDFFCSTAIFDFTDCNLFNKNQIRDLNLIHSPTSTIYVKNSYNEINNYLIHYWPFNDNYLDVISNANLIDGHQNFLDSDRFDRPFSSLKLVYGYLRAPNSFYINGDFTLTTWVNMEFDGSGVTLLLISLENQSIIFGLSNLSPPFFSYSNNNIVANTGLTIGKWQHLAFTVKDTKLSIYIDGVIDSNNEITPINYSNSSINLVQFGSDLTVAKFDDIKIFNKSLSQDEIIQSSLTYL